MLPLGPLCSSGQSSRLRAATSCSCRRLVAWRSRPHARHLGELQPTAQSAVSRGCVDCPSRRFDNQSFGLRCRGWAIVTEIGGHPWTSQATRLSRRTCAADLARMGPAARGCHELIGVDAQRERQGSDVVEGSRRSPASIRLSVETSMVARSATSCSVSPRSVRSSRRRRRTRASTGSSTGEPSAVTGRRRACRAPSPPPWRGAPPRSRRACRRRRWGRRRRRRRPRPRSPEARRPAGRWRRLRTRSVGRPAGAFAVATAPNLSRSVSRSGPAPLATAWVSRGDALGVPRHA
jgi:hypothetical protein